MASTGDEPRGLANLRGRPCHRRGPAPVKLSGAILGVFALLVTGALAPAAEADRPLRSEVALQTTLCVRCPPAAPEATLMPPPEGEIEDACGAAFAPSGRLYISDYYHRVIDVYEPTAGNQPASFNSQIQLPGSNPLFGSDNLDSACSLAFDGAGRLYAGEYHGGVVELSPTRLGIDSGESTGIAVDLSTERLFIDKRTYVAEYSIPVAPGDPPLRTLAADANAEYFGLGAYQGRIYLADAADPSVKVFEPQTSTSVPVATIDAGFRSLADASLAIDPSDGHLLVVDNLQPGYEHPISTVFEFDSAANGYAPLGRLPGAPVHGLPSGIAADSNGTLIVTDGNDELANAFAYGPYQEGFASPSAAATPSAPPPPATAAAASSPATQLAVPAATAATAAQAPKSRHHRKHRHHRRHQAGAGRR